MKIKNKEKRQKVHDKLTRSLAYRELIKELSYESYILSLEAWQLAKEELNIPSEKFLNYDHVKQEFNIKK